MTGGWFHAKHKAMKNTREILKPPNQEKKVLLHSCCAPCAGEVMESIVHSGCTLDLKNIQPKEEYEIQK